MHFMFSKQKSVTLEKKCLCSECLQLCVRVVCMQPLEDEARLSLSLREIYKSKHKVDSKGQEWDSLINSDASSPQVSTGAGLHTG